MFYVLSKGVDKKAPTTLEDGVDKYLNISFAKVREDWYKYHGNVF